MEVSLEDELIGNSAEMRRLRSNLRRIAESEATVLIAGETGTGKEIVARALHCLSARRDRNFVPVNCAAIPRDLFESEIFGFMRGGFTGAAQETPGLIEMARGGTLFLDEIEAMPLVEQPKLLRLIENREFKKIGSARLHVTDTRFVAATNQSPEDLLDTRSFRADLLYRLDVIRVTIPPLRERPGDVPVLIQHFLRKFNAAHGTDYELPSRRTLRTLTEYNWPGNVRELENLVRRSVLISEKSRISEEVMLAAIQRRQNGGDKSKLLSALATNRWHRSKTAAALGISRATLYRRLAREGLVFARECRTPPYGEVSLVDTSSQRRTMGGPEVS